MWRKVCRKTTITTSFVFGNILRLATAVAVYKGNTWWAIEVISDFIAKASLVFPQAFIVVIPFDQLLSLGFFLRLAGKSVVIPTAACRTPVVVACSSQFGVVCSVVYDLHYKPLFLDASCWLLSVYLKGVAPPGVTRSTNNTKKRHSISLPFAVVGGTFVFLFPDLVLWVTRSNFYGLALASSLENKNIMKQLKNSLNYGAGQWHRCFRDCHAFLKSNMKCRILDFSH